jgi:hypothetical protein
MMSLRSITGTPRVNASRMMTSLNTLKPAPAILRSVGSK